MKGISQITLLLFFTCISLEGNPQDFLWSASNIVWWFLPPLFYISIALGYLMQRWSWDSLEKADIFFSAGVHFVDFMADSHWHSYWKVRAFGSTCCADQKMRGGNLFSSAYTHPLTHGKLATVGYLLGYGLATFFSLVCSVCRFLIHLSRSPSRYLDLEREMDHFDLAPR